FERRGLFERSQGCFFRPPQLPEQHRVIGFVGVRRPALRSVTLKPLLEFETTVVCLRSARPLEMPEPASRALHCRIEFLDLGKPGALGAAISDDARSLKVGKIE